MAAKFHAGLHMPAEMFPWRKTVALITVEYQLEWVFLGRCVQICPAWLFPVTREMLP